MEAAGELLCALFPADSVSGESLEQGAMREEMAREGVIGAEVPTVTDGVLEGLVRTFKPGKAPGLDRIEVRILQKAWPLVYPWYGLIM